MIAEKNVIISTLISDCDLSIRTKKLFLNAGLNTIEDVLNLKLYDLMKYRGFGKRSLSEVRDFMSLHGFSFDRN